MSFQLLNVFRWFTEPWPWQHSHDGSPATHLLPGKVRYLYTSTAQEGIAVACISNESFAYQSASAGNLNRIFILCQ